MVEESSVSQAVIAYATLLPRTPAPCSSGMAVETYVVTQGCILSRRIGSSLPFRPRDSRQQPAEPTPTGQRVRFVSYRRYPGGRSRGKRRQQA